MNVNSNISFFQNLSERDIANVVSIPINNYQQTSMVFQTNPSHPPPTPLQKHTHIGGSVPEPPRTMFCDSSAAIDRESYIKILEKIISQQSEAAHSEVVGSQVGGSIPSIPKNATIKTSDEKNTFNINGFFFFEYK